MKSLRIQLAPLRLPAGSITTVKTAKKKKADKPQPAERRSLPESDPEYMRNVFVKVEEDDRFNELCSMLRGLLYANHNSAGQTTSNRQFKNGVTIEFGAGPSARDFVKSIRYFLKKRIRERVTAELRG